MHFVHLVEINDPFNPLVEPLTRTQLWHGLVMRAESPGAFVPHLDACAISDRSEVSMRRALSYGKVTICDEVHFLPQQQVRYTIPAQDDIPASTLVVTIEEPQPEWLHVRFEYSDERSGQETSDEAFYNAYRKSAYQEADIDTIRIIRQMAGEGRLDVPLQ